MNTKYFGEIAVDNSKKIYFPEGILGFEQYKEYYLIKFVEESEESVDDFIMCLQSVEDVNVAFFVMNPFYLLPEYDPYQVNDRVFEKIQLGEETKHTVYAIVSMRDTLEESTINLKSPVVVNLENQKGIQYVLDTNDYGLREPLASGEV